MKNRLKEKRTKLKLTQEQIARKTDITLTYYRNVESGKSIPTVEIAIKIMKALNEYDIEEIFIIEE